MKWTLAIILALVSFMAFGQAVDPASTNDVVSAIFGFMTTILQGKPAPAAIGLGISQLVILIVRAGWLDAQIGKVKMLVVSGLSILIPALTMYVADPSASIGTVFAHATVMGAIQVFVHQMYQHFIGKKANKV